MLVIRGIGKERGSDCCRVRIRFGSVEFLIVKPQSALRHPPKPRKIVPYFHPVFEQDETTSLVSFNVAKEHFLAF